LFWKNTLKDTRSTRSGRDRKLHLSADAERLVAAALGLSHAGSRVESNYWQRHLVQRLERLLESGHAQTVHDALERLDEHHPEGYAALIELVESVTESTMVEFDGQFYDVLLLAAPVVAWTRFRIPAGPIPVEAVNALAEAWQEQVLAAGVRFRMVPCLYSLDQLPRDFGELRRLMRKLGTAAIAAAAAGSRHDPSLKGLAQTADLLADGRFLLAGVAVPHGEPMFRWQQTDSPAFASRSACLEAWSARVRPVLETLLPGCGLECGLPDACHVSLRDVDRRVRPYAVKAAVHFLINTMGVDVAAIKATVAPFGETHVDEYRIGLSIGQSDDVVQGVVWPLLGPESDADDPGPRERIDQVLREAGVMDIRVWSKLTEPEFCEDCGVPLYPNPVGDVVHAEMPEDAEPDREHFH